MITIQGKKYRFQISDNPVPKGGALYKIQPAGDHTLIVAHRNGMPHADVLRLLTYAVAEAQCQGAFPNGFLSPAICQAIDIGIAASVEFLRLAGAVDIDKAVEVVFKTAPASQERPVQSGSGAPLGKVRWI